MRQQPHSVIEEASLGGDEGTVIRQVLASYNNPGVSASVPKDGCYYLAHKIFFQAIKDWIMEPQRHKEIERFVKSDWFEIVHLGWRPDGDPLVARRAFLKGLNSIEPNNERLGSQIKKLIDREV